MALFGYSTQACRESSDNSALTAMQTISLMKSVPSINVINLPIRGAIFAFLLMASIVAAQTGCCSSQVEPTGRLAASCQSTGNVLRGSCRFWLASQFPPASSPIELRIGSRLLGFLHPGRAGLVWNTADAPDGTYTLEAIAPDDKGGVPTLVADQVFQIQNDGNSLDVKAPDLTKSLSGNVTLSITAHDEYYYPAIFIVSIDGQNVADAWTDNAGRFTNSLTAQIDTTQFANGVHELYVGMFSDYWPRDQIANKTYEDWRAAFERIVTFNNVHQIREVRPNYLHIFLHPGESAQLSCKDVFSDDTSAKCMAPRFNSSDPSVVTVSGHGILSGEQEGFAAVGITDGNRSTQVFVWVRHSLGVPHLSGSGEVLHSYEPQKSLFITAPFDLEASDLWSDPDLLRSVQDAGINSLSEGFYRNPRNLRANYADWQREFDLLVTRRWKFAKENRLHILATGDEVCRNIGGEAWWTMNWTSGKKAVQYAMSALARSGVAVGVEMVDEVSMLWGGTPRPPGKIGSKSGLTEVSCSGVLCKASWPDNPVNNDRFPSGTMFALAGSRFAGLNTPAGAMFRAVNVTNSGFDFVPALPVNAVSTTATDPNVEFLWWAGNIGGCPTEPCDPPVPNDALIRINDWLHESVPAVPVTWPPLGSSSREVEANWIGRDGISDYASQYWTSSALRHIYKWSPGIQELTSSMSGAFYSRQSVVFTSRPQLMLVSAAGPMYIKRNTKSAYYVPGRDDLVQPGVSAEAVTAQMMTAAALGTSGIRIFAFDSTANRSARLAARQGSLVLTGFGPRSGDSRVQANWDAISVVCRSITKILAPYLLGVELNSPAYGPNFITAARQGLNGRLLMIVNGNDWYRSLRVDLRPYEYGKAMTRYLVVSNRMTHTSAIKQNEDSITLEPGQTAIYLFSPDN